MLIKTKIIHLELLLLLCFFSLLAGGQEQEKERPVPISDGMLCSFSRKAQTVERRLDQQTDTYLSKLQKQEAKLQTKLWKKDSLLAKQLFAGLTEKYSALKRAHENLPKYNQAYSGHLDSLTTAVNFLKAQNLPSPELQKTLAQFSSLQEKFNQTEAIKQFLSERKKLLKESLEHFGMLNELKGFQKQSYYYAAQIREYKELWENPSKLENKLLEVVLKNEKFKDFFNRNSQLGSFFGVPANYGSPVALVGLQTRFQLQQSLTQRMGTASINGLSPRQYLQKQVQEAQSQLSQVKAKLANMGVQSGDGTTEMPNFKPNTQKTKTFLQRIEYGLNIQNQKGSTFLPVTSDLALSVGYKLTDKSTVGLGASYKLGLGKGFQNLQLSNQGIGVRSFLDWKIKGSFWLAGGFEYNYMQAFKNLPAISDADRWQKSGLIGVTKKITLSKNKVTSVQLFYDLLAHTQVPASPSLKFRIGYTFHK